MRVFSLLVLLALAPSAWGQTSRLKDLVVPGGAAPVQVTGYGIVVGLDRTGDRARGTSGAPYTVQGVANMLQRFGIAVDPATLGTRNAAAVLVTATVDPFAGPGAPLDVTVSSLGDARSLAGGVLLQTPLQDMAAGGEVVALAQGPLLTGTVSAQAGGASARTGPTNTARVPGGGTVVRPPDAAAFGAGGTLDLVMRRPDFTNAAAVAEAVNGLFPGAAVAVHAGLVRVQVPPAGPAALIAAVESARVGVDVPARVVVNERTGTVVAGGGVRIGEAMITYGALTIQTAVDPVVSQPEPFSRGETVRARAGRAQIDQAPARSVVLAPNADVAELAAALNDLGLTARDVIAVFQALDRAGALHGELVVL